MKRTNNAPAQAGGGNKPAYVPKKPRGEDNDEFFDEGDMMDADMIIEEAIEGAVDDSDPNSGRINWKRNSLPADFNPKTQSLAFHWLDIDMTSGMPLSENPDGGAVVGSLSGPVPVIRLYGVNQQGMR